MTTFKQVQLYGSALWLSSMAQLYTEQYCGEQTVALKSFERKWFERKGFEVVQRYFQSAHF